MESAHQITWESAGFMQKKQQEIRVVPKLFIYPTLFRTAVSNWQAPRVIFYKKKAGPESGRLREYRLPQRAINGRNRMPKAAFDQTAMASAVGL